MMISASKVASKAAKVVGFAKSKEGKSKKSQAATASSGQEEPLKRNKSFPRKVVSTLKRELSFPKVEKLTKFNSFPRLNRRLSGATKSDTPEGADDVAQLTAQAQAARESGEYLLARAFLDEAFENRPDDHMLKISAASMLLKAGELDLANEELNELLSWDTLSGEHRDLAQAELLRVNLERARAKATSPPTVCAAANSASARVTVATLAKLAGIHKP